MHFQFRMLVVVCGIVPGANEHFDEKVGSCCGRGEVDEKVVFWYSQQPQFTLLFNSMFTMMTTCPLVVLLKRLQNAWKLCNSLVFFNLTSSRKHDILSLLRVEHCSYSE